MLIFLSNVNKPASVILNSTGQKYIYTGSHDSCIYIYDLVRPTFCRASLFSGACLGYLSRARFCIFFFMKSQVTGAQVAKLKHHKSTVRDCSWHPSYPMLVSSSWDGDVVKWESPGSGEAPAPANTKRLRRRHFY